MAKGLKRSTVEGWKKDLDPGSKWLKYECSEDPKRVIKITCSACTEFEEKINQMRNFSRAAIEGLTGTAMKKDNVVKHSQSEPHKKACLLKSPQVLTLDQIYKSTPIGRSISSSKTLEEERICKLMDIAYMLAKHELPFTKFQPIVEMERKHGADVGTAYQNDVKCNEFTAIIGEGMREELLIKLRQSNYFAILIDGATDKHVTENEMIYCRFNNPDTAEVEFSFLSLTSVENARGYGIKHCIEKVLQEAGLADFNKRMIGFMADGANVNMGQKDGLAGLLKRDNDMPWLVSIHCLNHRLELAVKDAFTGTMIKDVTDMLESLYKFYQYSPKRLRELRELAEILDETVNKPERANGTRWVQFKRRACATLVKSYNVITGHMENLAEDSSTKGEDKAKIKGYLTKMKTFQFVATLLLLSEILEPLSKLSLFLQGDSIDFIEAIAALHRTCTTLDSLGVKDVDENQKFKSGLTDLLAAAGPSLPETINPESAIDVEAQGVAHGQTPTPDVYFRMVKLTHVAQGLAKFESTRQTLVQKLKDCVDKRFVDLKHGVSHTHFSALKLLDTSLWPSNKDDLMDFGNAEIATFIDQFKVLLERNNVDVEEILNEWGQMKIFWNDNMRHLTYKDIWCSILMTRADKYPNFIHVIQILRIYPVSNAKVERGFSAVNRVKTDWRSRLSTDTLCHLLRVDLEGIEPRLFDPTPYARRFFSKRRHPNVEPYGSRKKIKKD